MERGKTKGDSDSEDVERQSLTDRVRDTDREAIDRVQTSETPEKPPTESSVISSQYLHAVDLLKPSETPAPDDDYSEKPHEVDFYKHSEEKATKSGDISSQVNQTETVSEVVKMAKDAQGSVVMSQTSGETNVSFTADCPGEGLAKSNQVNQTGTVSEVVKMAKDAQGSVVMSQTSGETNVSLTADCREERLAKSNQVFC